MSTDSSEQRHSLGPWRVGDAGHTVFGPPRDDGQLPEIIASEIRRGPNARLMAAGPALLGAAHSALSVLDDTGQLSDYARACIREEIAGAISSTTL